MDRQRIMNADETPSFETNDHERVYECVEHNGAVASAGLHEAMQLGGDRVADVVADLEREGYVTKVDGRLELDLGTGTAATHDAGDTGVTIRPTRQADLPAVVDVIRNVVGDVLYPGARDLATRLTRASALNRHNGDETRVFFVSTVDGGIVGWVHVGASRLQRLRGTVELTLGVRAEYRGRGIGSRLLERGCEWAAASSYRKGCQRLPATNDRSISFLESRGWETETIRRNHYDRGERQVDETVIGIELP